jgi:uncharacterized membrane protein YvlD (DUF360 family)
MISFLIRTAINAAALLIIARLSNGAIIVNSVGAAAVVALLLGIAGATVKPILLYLAHTMTCALTCLTLGLWSLFLSFLVNGLLFWLAAQFIDGFGVRNNSFWIAAIGALILAIVNAFATAITKKDNEK